MIPNATEIREKIRNLRALPVPEERRRLRVTAGLSLQDIATSVEVTRATVSRWENGLLVPSQDHISAYLAVLSVIAEELQDTDLTNP